VFHLYLYVPCCLFKRLHNIVQNKLRKISSLKFVFFKTLSMSSLTYMFLKNLHFHLFRYFNFEKIALQKHIFTYFIWITFFQFTFSNVCYKFENTNIQIDSVDWCYTIFGIELFTYHFRPWKSKYNQNKFPWNCHHIMD